MKRTVCWTLLILLMLGTSIRAQDPPVVAPPAPVAGDDEMIEMHGIDKLDTLLGFVDLLSEKVLVYDASVKTTKVKIYGPAKVPRKDLLRFVEAILEMNGYAMTEAPGNILRVIPIAGTNEPIALRVGMEEELPESSATITQVIKLEYADIAKVNNLVRSMITARDGKVQIYDDLNLLFITDAAFKIKKITRVIQEIDKPSPKVELETIKIEHAPAGEIAKMLDSLMQRKATREKAGKKSIDRAYIVAEERSSSIVVLGLREEIDDVKKILGELDRPLNEIGGVFHSYQLKNQSADDLAKVLVDLYQKKAVAERAGRKPGTEQEMRQPSIVPEPNTNSLLIIAPSDVYEEMAGLIATLDVRRPQVLIEVMLVELKLDQTSEWGLELATGDEPKRGESTAVAATGFGFSDVGLDENGIPIRIPTLGTGLTAAMFRGTTHIPLILRAWETAGDVEVLAVPRVLTNDNADATISIGDEVPYQKTTIQDTFRDITWGFSTATMELAITPHISEADHVRLDLAFKVERFGAQLDSTSPPPKSVRNATTKVTVPNESTIIIGGLTHTNIRDSESRVPFLHKIPLIGNAFKRSTKVRTKTHLFIFITPHILREESFSDLSKISSKVEVKMTDLREGEDWRPSVGGTWGLNEDETIPLEGRSDVPPKVIPLKAKTVIEEEKKAVEEPKSIPAPEEKAPEPEKKKEEETNAGKPEDPFKAREKRDSRRD